MNKKHLGYLALAGAAILALAYALTASYDHHEHASNEANDHAKEIGKGGHHGGGHHGGGHHGHHGGGHHGHHGNFNHHDNFNHHGNWGDHHGNWNNGGYVEGEGIYNPGYLYNQPAQQSYYYTQPGQSVPVQTNTPIRNNIPTNATIPNNTTVPSTSK